MTQKDAAKLASATSDLVFIPIPPCRIVDSRSALGPIASGTARQYFYYSSNAALSWSSQGGIGGLASSACPGSALNGAGGTLGSVAPAAAVATVTVVNDTTGPGNLVVWGGALPVPTTSALNWTTAGDVIANTTTIPWGGRTGGTEDFAIFFNGTGGSTDVVVDVVGYFVENTATALQCVTLTASGTGTVGAGATATVALPACTTGYAKTSGGCSLSATGGYLIEQSPSLNNCMWVNNTGGPVPAGTYQAEAVCCRLPGQ